MRTERFRGLVGADGPFASVYLDDSHDTENADRRLELEWRGHRDELRRAGATDAVLRVLDTATAARPPAGRSGRALIATEGGVLVDEHLIRPPVAGVSRWSEVPYLLPLIEHGPDTPSHVIVAVDHTGGDLTVVRRDGSRETETVDGGGYPVHKASGAETAGYGDPQQRTDEQARKNIRAVADRLAAVVDTTGAEIVFVIGEVRSRADLTEAVVARVAERSVELHVGARHSGIGDDEIAHAVDQELERRRNRTLADAAERYDLEKGRGSGYVVEGLTAVCGALRNGEVETLVVGEIGDATVVDDGTILTIAPDPNNLSELGTAPQRTLRADEALVMAAVSIDAAIVRIDERIDPKEGVAAILRFVPRTSADRDQDAGAANR